MIWLHNNEDCGISSSHLSSFPESNFSQHIFGPKQFLRITKIMNFMYIICKKHSIQEEDEAIAFLQATRRRWALWAEAAVLCFHASPNSLGQHGWVVTCSASPCLGFLVWEKTAANLQKLPLFCPLQQHRCYTPVVRSWDLFFCGPRTTFFHGLAAQLNLRW